MNSVVKPSLTKVQVTPASVEVKTPADVPAKSTVGASGATTRACTLAPEGAEPAADHVTAPSVLR